MIKLLDTHQHLVYRSVAGYSWAKDIPPLAENNFTVEDYLNLTKGQGIEGTLFMETGVDDPDYKSEAKHVQQLAENSNNGIKGLIVSIRPEEDSEFNSWFDRTIEMNVAGYRRILHVMPDETSQNQKFRDNVKKIGKAGKPFDICYLPTQLSIAYDFASHCDEMNLVLNHCGVPSIAAGEIDQWGKDIKKLSELKNVICKLSGLMAYCAPGTSSQETIKPYVDHVLECFGPSRIVWGSDWPVVNLGQGIQEWIKVTRNILSNLSDDEAALIANLNAQRVYNTSL
ncbi:amidohydrolase family protein [bacterium]|nr:amidohydrolase family protein [bacterium]